MSLINLKNKVLAEHKGVQILYSNEDRYTIFEHSVMVQKSKINYTFDGFDDGSREVIRVSAFGHNHMRLMRKEIKMPKFFQKLFLYRLNQSVKKAIYMASP